ncbi:retention module-containing protein, partial [Shewanella algae]|uniref:retention module-containing protein n=1 Tax=Shewanella algae TaxID=38313 RepID=UPI0031F5BF6A
MKALITTQDGQVKTLNGKAYVMSNGQQMPLQQGDFVAQGSEVFVDNDAQIELLLSDGSRLVSEAEVTQEALQNADSATDSEIAQLQALIAAGEDPTASLPDTAAGGAQGNEGTSGFVSLARSGAETLAASGYDSAGVEADAITLQDGLSQNTFELTQVAPSTVTLLAPTQVNEGGSITYTAVVDNAPLESDLVLTLSNGATIVIPVGQTSGSVTVDAPSDDVYLDSEVLNVGVTESQGGNYENLDLGNSVDTQVNDTIDTTTVTLTAPAEVNEGGQITYTATVNNAPETDLVLTLSNGASITIAAGQTSGTVTVDAPTDDVYQDGETLTVGITDAQGGNYEELNLGNSVDTQVNDTIDTTTVTLTAPAEVNEGGQITYTATVNNAPETDLVLTLSNGASITIAAGQTSGTVTVDAPTDDVYLDGEILTVGITDAQGGNYENLDTSDTASTQVNDTIDTTTVTLTAPAQVNEGGQISYTATVNNAPETDLVLTLSNGASVTIAAGQTSGTVTVDAPTDDVYQDGETLTVGITDAQGGNYENLDTSDTASTQVNDTIDTTTVTLTVPAEVNEGGQISYTATVNNAPETDLVLTLSNGASITIAAGQTSGTVTVDAPTDDVYLDGETLTVGITDAQGGNYEDLNLGNSVDTQVNDTIDTTTVTLTGPTSVMEGEATDIYTVTLSNPAPVGSIVALSYSYSTANGDDIIETVQAVIGEDGLTATFSISTVADQPYEGPESFTVNISDITNPDGTLIFEQLDLSNASVETSIIDTNSPPTTDDTSAMGEEDSNGIEVSLVGSDPDGSVNYFILDTSPANGTLLLNGVEVQVGDQIPTSTNSATLIFVPNADWHGETSFTYHSIDNAGLADNTPATVDITVTPVDDSFTDADEVITMAEDSGLHSGTLLTGTSSVDGPVTVQSFSVDGNSYTFDDTHTSFSVTLAAGTLVINQDGTYSFTPAADWNGTVPLVKYTLTDGSSTDDSTLAINVTPVDDELTLTGLDSTGAEQTVSEAHLADGSAPDAAALTQSGSFGFSSID